MSFWLFRRKEPDPATPEQRFARLIATAARAGPEKNHVVEIANGIIRSAKPDGTVESIALDDLSTVELVGTDWGPFLPDQFWFLQARAGHMVVIPLGATGDNKLMHELQALPGFRNDVIVEAMSLTSNVRLLCWQSPTDSQTGSASD